MEKSFPVDVIEGKGYVVMKSEVFIEFFNEIFKYKNIDSLLLDEINKRYCNSQKIKRKRVRLKKEKDVLIVMYNILLNEIGYNRK